MAVGIRGVGSFGRGWGLLRVGRKREENFRGKGEISIRWLRYGIVVDICFLNAVILCTLCFDRQGVKPKRGSHKPMNYPAKLRSTFRIPNLVAYGTAFMHFNGLVDPYTGFSLGFC